MLFIFLGQIVILTKWSNGLVCIVSHLFHFVYREYILFYILFKKNRHHFTNIWRFLVPCLFVLLHKRQLVVQSAWFECHFFAVWCSVMEAVKQLDLIKHSLSILLSVWFTDWHCCHCHCISEEARFLFVKRSYSTIEKEAL